MRDLQRPMYRIRVSKCPHGDDAMEVKVWKAWWGGPGIGGRQRELWAYCIPANGDIETERVARALESVVAALRG